MKLNELFADDDAVSPVIGVILMVAITVILAAVIGTFVLGLGGQVQNNAPSAQFTFNEEDNGALTMTHDGGQSVSTSNIEVTNDDSSKTYVSDGICQNNSYPGGENWTSAELSAGDACTIPTGEIDDGDTVRITWESDEGGTSATLTDYEY
ncbi:type IV pilin [Halobacteriales archaeon QS_4_69_225]|nr:MAG: type IV pilin [Halobacteriales archaeon QS_4_69_225]